MRFALNQGLSGAIECVFEARLGVRGKIEAIRLLAELAL
jgi:hypothetical protein